MQGGDIDNTPSRRFVVTFDYVTVRRPVIKKILGIVPHSSIEFEWDHMALSYLWNQASRFGVVLELAVFGDGFDKEGMMEQLDEYGTNPFNYIREYDNTVALARSLPYRNDVLGVVCTSSEAGAYGSWAVPDGR